MRLSHLNKDYLLITYLLIALPDFSQSLASVEDPGGARGHTPKLMTIFLGLLLTAGCDVMLGLCNYVALRDLFIFNYTAKLGPIVKTSIEDVLMSI